MPQLITDKVVRCRPCSAKFGGRVTVSVKSVSLDIFAGCYALSAIRYRRRIGYAARSNTRIDINTPQYCATNLVNIHLRLLEGDYVVVIVANPLVTPSDLFHHSSAYKFWD